MIILKKLNSIFKMLIRYISLCIPRKKEIVIFGSWFGEKFSDNSKYLYLECINDPEIRPIWISKNDEVINMLVEKGYEAYKWNTIKAIFYQLIGKYYFTTTGQKDVQHYLMGGATHIELWHGVPLKKIMYDNNFYKDPNKYILKIKESINYIFNKKYYVASSSEEISKIYSSAFRVPYSNILQFGQPRNDIFYKDEIELDESYKYLKEKKIILYMPTHRNMGKVKIDVNSLFDLNKLNSLCKENDYIFLIKKHFYHRDEVEKLGDYENIIDITDKDIDSQLLLKYTDILITDYSSCYIDYLLLNKPVIFYNFDFDNYILNDREMYFDYEAVTPGAKVTTKDEIYNEIQKLIYNKDEFRIKREEVCNIFYDTSVQREVSSKFIKVIKNN